MSIRSKVAMLFLFVSSAVTGCGSNGASSSIASQGEDRLAILPSAIESQPSENLSAGSGRKGNPLRGHYATKSGDLLYVTNVYTVTVYSYPNGKLMRTLQGFSLPMGECVDDKQDVFITNFNTGQIFEYAHGGRNPIATLKSASGGPAGCSIDPTTGDLAVSSLGGGSTGSVGVYKYARGNPKVYRNRDFQEYFYCGYDANGNLFVDGQSSDARFEFAELAKHAVRLKTVTLNASIGFPGGVQWDGKYVAVGDSNALAVYRFTISGDVGTEVGSTSLGGSDVSDVSQFFITGKKLLAPNHCTGSCTGNLLYYDYPAGGNPTKTISKGVRYPHGVVVSKG